MEKVKYKICRTSGAGFYRDESPYGDAVKREGYCFYTIEFNSQSELLDFIKNNGEVVIKLLDKYEKGYGCNFEIEIYDYYRE